MGGPSRFSSRRRRIRPERHSTDRTGYPWLQQQQWRRPADDTARIVVRHRICVWAVRPCIVVLVVGVVVPDGSEPVLARRIVAQPRDVRTAVQFRRDAPHTTRILIGFGPMHAGVHWQRVEWGRRTDGRERKGKDVLLSYMDKKRTTHNASMHIPPIFISPQGYSTLRYHHPLPDIFSSFST